LVLFLQGQLTGGAAFQAAVVIGGLTFIYF